MKETVKRIREIDERIKELFEEKEKLLQGYTTKERNELHDKVWADGKSHYSF